MKKRKQKIIGNGRLVFNTPASLSPIIFTCCDRLPATTSILLWFSPPFTAKFIKEGIAQNIASYVLLHKSQQNVINLTNVGPTSIKVSNPGLFSFSKV